MFHSPVNFLGNVATVKLNLHDIGLLLPFAEHFLLCVHNNSDACAISLHLCNISTNSELTKAVLPPLGSMYKSTFLRLVPVLVEAPAALFSKMLSEDSLKASWAMRSLNVPSNTNHHNWRALQDGHRL